MTGAGAIREIQRLMDMSRTPAPATPAQEQAHERRIAALLGIEGGKDEGGGMKDETEGGAR